jgi:hypothetical protein
MTTSAPAAFASAIAAFTPATPGLIVMVFFAPDASL